MSLRTLRAKLICLSISATSSKAVSLSHTIIEQQEVLFDQKKRVQNQRKEQKFNLKNGYIS
ncbi:hypothetical protein BLOT_011193 [Blomia tropicalis]|nr:hypothetical protein BLOT_011193 [Blomia tropicalis]